MAGGASQTYSTISWSVIHRSAISPSLPCPHTTIDQADPEKVEWLGFSVCHVHGEHPTSSGGLKHENLYRHDTMSRRSPGYIGRVDPRHHRPGRRTGWRNTA